MDAQYIADVLGAVVVDSTNSDHPGYSLRLVSPDLNLRLRLEVSATFHEVRLFVERYRRRGPSFIGAITLYDLQSVTAEMAKGEVHFIGTHTELSVKRSGVFVVSCL